MSQRVRFRSLLAGLLLLPGMAAADTGDFTAPRVKGVRLDWCAHFGTDCGKPAADLFCREKGFATATRFAIEQNVGARGVDTLVFGDGRLCQGPNCSGFRAITCSRPDPVVTRVTPPAKKPDVIVVAPKTGLVAPRKKPGVVIAAPNVGLKTPGKSGLKATNPVFVLPGGALLYRPSGDFQLTTDIDIDPNAAAQFYPFAGDVSKIGPAGGFRWQVATKPFPPFANGAPSDLKPANLIASGDEAGKSRTFSLDFKKLAGNARGAKPANFYVRVLPLAKAGGNILAGQPSNVIRVYYSAKAPEQAPIVIYDTKPPQLFSVKVVSFTPPDFEDPNRWGCVTVTGYKEGGMLSEAFKSAYPVGAVVCPKSYKGSSYQITSVGEFVEWAAGGVVDLWDWTAGAYATLKKLAVDVVMKYTPFGLQCELAAKAIGKATDANASNYCRMAAEIGVNAGMAALGLPPSLPSYNELVDKGVDQAVELAAQKITEQAGIPCEGPCRDALKSGFGEAADELKKKSYMPGCVGEDEAHEHGREPLCLPDFIVAKPAPRAIYRPPIAVVAVTRLYADKDPKNMFKGECRLGVDLDFENTFAAKTVWGPFNNTKDIPEQPVSGMLYAGEGLGLSQSTPKGATSTYVLAFDQPLKFIFPWTKQLWAKSQIPPHDFMGPDWYTLYSGSWATVTAGVNCGKALGKLAQKMPALW